ncbi:hypothetical protein SAMN02800694_2594 [Luteibacter sp. UNCMF331Sha3.1]|uniref:hypothetical protein n=1 Tax=Luteibacter sp. UNCMF331Sha3.1 TaxID=1502760 RepID=UPI0008D49194|nr:hypothetical protein [Luteibacter sp. UNCMF331Sha3.1]SEN04539.1 hypothetical protein SAMN02800694_2594 [Luteibacter sp. UNCMF331Sha3.1]
MRFFLAIIYCFMNLAGCTDTQNRTLTASARENGTVTLESRTEVRMGRARFACEASRSGHCWYTVFDEGREVRAFSLAAREERLVDDLPAGFTLCVTTDAGKVNRDCKPV